MTIAFTRLFTTLGLLAGALNEVNTYRGTTLTARANDLFDQYVTSSVYSALVDPVFTNREAAASAQDTYVGALGTAASAAILAEVVADRPLVNETLDAALAELVRQMTTAAESLNDCPGSVTVTDVGTPTGDHQFAFGVYDATSGKKTDFLVPDVYRLTLSADRSTGGTKWAETFSVVGKPADSLPTDASYPSGTGLDTSVTAVDPANDFGIASGGGFDSSEWSGNTPSEWSLGTGVVAGTHVLKKTSDDPRGTGASNCSLRLVGDGSVLVKLRQQVTVSPSTLYAVHFRIKKVADPGTDWGVSLRLVDGTSFAALAGPGSYSNVVTSATAGSVASSWANPVKGLFVTPAVLPTDAEGDTSVYLEILFHQFSSLTTAPANTAEVYVDHISVQEVTPLYSGGPTLAVFSGITEGVVGDLRTGTVALDSGAPSAYLIRGIDRLVGLAARTARIPTVSGGSETQADALVT